jgi:FtsP/CotA-like multicopper oxidase with cupredoxin domain/sugar lactone lactonase YvrE
MRSFLIASAAVFSVQANPLYKATNVSPNPTLTNEFYLTATNITTSINGTNVKVLIYMDDPPGGGGAPKQIPGPLIEANVGQTIICHFKNRLTNNVEGVTIHWHGIELDNDSDGTGVTQDTIFNGQTYTYRFVVTRPGVYWYHSHMIPGTTTFGGMYGPILVHDPNEAALIAANVLPPTNRTFQLVLSDISFTNGVVGKVVNGTNYSLNTLIQICENAVLNIPGGPPSDICGAAGRPGDVFLCNGSVPSRAGNFCTPTTNSSPVFYIGKNQRVRLQLINASISRNTYLTLRYPCSNPAGNTNLYHVGGQGGLLDTAVLEGGVQSGYDFRYGKGTVNLGSGMRTDVMFYSSGNAGDVIQLVGNPTTPNVWNISASLPTNYPVAFFVITNGGTTNAPLAAGSPILTAVGAANENLRLLQTNALTAPPYFGLGTSSSAIVFSNSVPINGSATGPTIGGYAATPLDGNSGNGSWPFVPHPPTALWAGVGTVLQLAIANSTADSAHPYHLHGFSMQPVAIYTADLKTNLYNFPNNEFVDTMDVLKGQALVFRIKLEDRPVLADSATGGPVTTGISAASGGGLGRWLMHCHIFLHGAIGMISELVVVPNKFQRLVGPQAGTNSVLLAAGSGVAWTATNNVPWLHLLSGSESGTGNDTVLFAYDANLGPPRFGTLNVGGAMVEVTQAGTNYVPVPGPATGLVTTNINAPFGVAVDDDGNVFFTDSANGAVKKWTKSNNTVSSFLSGLSTPYGLGLDQLGNVYVAQFGSAVVKKRFAPNPPVVVNLFTNSSSGIAGLAVDEAANVYITDPGDKMVKKWTAATGVLSSYTTNGLVSPWGVAVDKTGAVYASDIGDDTVKKLGIRIISFSPLIIAPYWNTLTTISNLSNPYNLTVDDGGNIFVADYSHGAIKKFTVANNTVSTVVSGLNSPIGVVVDKTGNLFLCDWGGNAVREQPYAYVDPRPQYEPAELTVDQFPPVLLPDANLLPPFAPTPNAPWILYGGSTTGVVQFAVTANPGAPRSSSISVLGTNIIINQAGSYFALGTTNLLVGPSAGSNTITAALIPASSNWFAATPTPWVHLPSTTGSGTTNLLFTYDVNPSFTRTGSISINSRIVRVTQAGSTYVQAPGPFTTLVSTGLLTPWGVGVDGLGNVIISDTSHSAIKKWTPASNVTAPLTTTGLVSPESIALDAAGNIYIADASLRAIKQRRASDGVLLTLVDDWPYSTTGVAVDLATNVYWSGPTDDSVKKRLAADGSVSTLIATNLNGAYGLAVDVAGNLFIADTINHAVKKWNPVTSSLTTLTTSNIGSPWNVAVDGSGNVYVANGISNNIVKWTAASGKMSTLVPSGVLNLPTGITVDAAQNIYVADFNAYSIHELPYAFVDPSPRSVPFTAGSDALPPVVPANQNLAAPFAPTVSAPWLNITNVSGGVVSFNYGANTNLAARSAFITLLGQNVFVLQDGAPPVPVFTGIGVLTNGVFQLSFTNGIRGGVYSVLFSTNLLVPLTNWPVIGTATNNGAGVWQFTDLGASNATRFYRIRSP